MYDSLEEEVEFSRKSSYAIQFTGGTHEEYKTLIHDIYPSPVVEFDCSKVTSYDDFFAVIESELSTTADDYLIETHLVEDHFEANGGTLVLYNFDQMDSETISDLAMFIKSLYESLNFSGDREMYITLTVEDDGALLLGNGDLTGRVRTVNLAEY